MRMKTFTTLLLAGSVPAHGAITSLSPAVAPSNNFFSDSSLSTGRDSLGSDETAVGSSGGTLGGTLGALSADFDRVPEPSSALLLALGSLGLVFRRFRGPRKS